jgi:hypothetical protein
MYINLIKSDNNGTVTYKIMDRHKVLLSIYKQKSARFYPLTQIIRLNFILFIHYIDLIVIFR